MYFNEYFSLNSPILGSLKVLSIGTVNLDSLRDVVLESLSTGDKFKTYTSIVPQIFLP